MTRKEIVQAGARPTVRKPFGWLVVVTRAKKPARLPVMFTRGGAILRVFMNVGLVILLVALTGMGQERARPRWSTSALEQRIHVAINAERARNRLPGLQLDEDLSRIARAHSLDMATRDFFDHVNPEGRTPSDRGDAGGLPCRRDLPDGSYAIGLAENLFQNNLYNRVMFVDGKPSYAWNSLEHIVATTVQGWMKSRGHRTNILGRSHDRTGIGIALTPDDKVLITQLFC
ncbi:MAG: CAP domain-containing protein [Gammaproteobacteria bacterium]